MSSPEEEAIRQQLYTLVRLVEGFECPGGAGAQGGGARAGVDPCELPSRQGQAGPAQPPGAGDPAAPQGGKRGPREPSLTFR